MEVGPTEAAAFGVKPDYFEGQRIDPLLHVRPDDSDTTTRAMAVAAFKDIVASCIQAAKDGAIEIEGTDNDQGRQYCLVTLARCEETIAGAAAFIVRCQDEQTAEIALTRVRQAATGF